MNDKEFKQMLDGLVDQEEKHLQVNSEEFKRRHRELVELIRKAERGEDNGRKAQLESLHVRIYKYFVFLRKQLKRK